MTDKHIPYGCAGEGGALVGDRFDEIIASSRSAVVRRTAMLTERQRRLLGVTSIHLAVASVMFEMCEKMLDDDDPRPPFERLEDLEELAERLSGLGVEKMFEEWSLHDKPEPPRWMLRFGKQNHTKFMRRFIGAGPYDQLEQAARADGAVMFVAARRSLRYLLPMATAFDHIVGVLSPDQVHQIEGLETIAASSLLWVGVTADSKLTTVLADKKLVVPGVARPEELKNLPGSLGDLMTKFCGEISDKSGELIEELATSLNRKVRGARDALQFSADPVSQAANSLIELIDRLLREAFTADEVLSWVRTWHPDDFEQLTYALDGQRRPTKRSQALCFVYAGGEVTDQSLIHDLSATALVAIRNRLQQLKHSDQGTPDEKDQLVQMLVSIESVLLLICNFAWLGAGEDRLSELKTRLAAA